MSFLDMPIEGININLRSVDIGDAEFTLNLRNDSQHAKHFPNKAASDLASQEKWIIEQRERQGDYFFIIENKCKGRLGTIALCNIDLKNREAESGRWIAIGDPIQNVESALLLFDFGFMNMSIEVIHAYVLEQNIVALNVNKKFGFRFQDEVVLKDDIRFWVGQLRKEEYLKDEKVNMMKKNIVKMKSRFNGK